MAFCQLAQFYMNFPHGSAAVEYLFTAGIFSVV